MSAAVCGKDRSSQPESETRERKIPEVCLIRGSLAVTAWAALDFTILYANYQRCVSNWLLLDATDV